MRTLVYEPPAGYGTRIDVLRTLCSIAPEDSDKMLLSLLSTLLDIFENLSNGCSITASHRWFFMESKPLELSYEAPRSTRLKNNAFKLALTDIQEVDLKRLEYLVAKHLSPNKVANILDYAVQIGERIAVEIGKGYKIIAMHQDVRYDCIGTGIFKPIARQTTLMAWMDRGERMQKRQLK